MKKILGLALSALIVMGMVGGGTWAYFTDTETASGSVTAGTLDLELDGDNVAVTLFTATNVYPGQTGNGSTVLSNNGNVAAELDITFGSANNTESTGTTEFEADGGSGELGASLEIAVYIDVDQSGNWTSGDIGIKSDATKYAHPTALDYAAANDYAGDSVDNVYTGTMAAAATDTFRILWRVPTTAGNTIQGDTVNITITFTLEQAEED